MAGLQPFARSSREESPTRTGTSFGPHARSVPFRLAPGPSNGDELVEQRFGSIALFPSDVVDHADTPDVIKAA
jgi:hypothetical protein